ncbi:hypothetical protein [Actinoplanes derwentensis]|uniref:Uncharacterized protein n=1 Tax=Actinoplanes derwentensis TaxID=113562 RepID=A0A1H2CVX1_9ACTN|nr:hypothetical protein [Actinoplanes derwentensis]GID82065.1 hypothetical protein Ade03nite_09890 [Actinoplanes derwentensis]SDT74524.1 hypothetical protein SAMN04489716_7009 [Actinoplanes derwentensis]
MHSTQRLKAVQAVVADANRFPRLAVAGLDTPAGTNALASLIRLVTCGWDLRTIDGVLQQISGSAAGSVRDALQGLAHLAHFPPGEALKWMDLWPGAVDSPSLWEELARTMDLWRLLAPAGLARTAVGQGISVDEADALRDRGELHRVANATLLAVQAEQPDRDEDGW